MHISSEHEERLKFIKEYFSTIENAAKFAADQVFVREVASLKLDRFSSDDEISKERITEVQLFSIEVSEMIRAQMVIILWAYFENLFLSATRSIALHKGISRPFKKLKEVSLVESWKRYLVEEAKFESDISEQDWEMLVDTSHVRNLIAHQSHRPGSQPTGRQMEAIERLKGIKVTLDGISVSRNFIESHLYFANEILAKLSGDHWLESESFDLS